MGWVAFWWLTERSASSKYACWAFGMKRNVWAEQSKVEAKASTKAGTSFDRLTSFCTLHSDNLWSGFLLVIFSSQAVFLPWLIACIYSCLHTFFCHITLCAYSILAEILAIYGCSPSWKSQFFSVWLIYVQLFSGRLRPRKTSTDEGRHRQKLRTRN